MKRLTTLLSLLMLLFYGCSTNEDLTFSSQTEEIGLIPKISVPDTCSNLSLNVVKRIGENIFSKSSSRGIFDLEVIPLENEDGSVIAYIINRGNNDGYVVISANKQSYPIIAMSDNGSLDVNSILDTPIKNWISHMASVPRNNNIPDSIAVNISKEWDIITRVDEPYTNASRSTGDSDIDNTISQAIAIWNSQGYTVTSVASANASAYPSTIANAISNIQQSGGLISPNPAQTSFVLSKSTDNTNRVGPYIKTQWSIYPPYNETIKYFRDVVPQTVIAVAQVMYYHNKPDSLGLKDLPLSIQTATSKDPLPIFISMVTFSCGFDVSEEDYNGNLYYAELGLSHYGYSFDKEGFNVSKITSSLRNHGPAILEYEVESEFYFIWICDGFNTSTTTTSYKVMSYSGDFADIDPTAAFSTIASDNVYSTSPMALHFVFGYNSSIDGYYFNNDWSIQRSANSILNISGSDVETLINIR